MTKVPAVEIGPAPSNTENTSSSQSHTRLIKLPPSPRDVPHVYSHLSSAHYGFSSSRSFRSHASARPVRPNNSLVKQNSGSVNDSLRGGNGNPVDKHDSTSKNSEGNVTKSTIGSNTRSSANITTKAANTGRNSPSTFSNGRSDVSRLSHRTKKKLTIDINPDYMHSPEKQSRQDENKCLRVTDPAQTEALQARCPESAEDEHIVQGSSPETEGREAAPSPVRLADTCEPNKSNGETCNKEKETTVADTSTPRIADADPSHTPSQPTHNHPSNQMQDQFPSQNRTQQLKTRNKKIVVIDPKSGQKYHLNHDDHSLTNKELHVYHKVKNIKMKIAKKTKGSGNNSTTGNDDNASASNSTYYTSSEDHTLSTASALTEVSDYQRDFGHMKCFPSICHSVGKLAFGLDPTLGDEYTEREDENNNDGYVDVLAKMKPFVDRERRDEVEDDRSAGKKTQTNSSERRDRTVQDKLTCTLGGLVSPRMTMIARSFFADGDMNDEIRTPTTPKMKEGVKGFVEEMKYRRIPLVVFPEEIAKVSLNRENPNGNKGADSDTLIGMTFEQCPDDFQAHVKNVVHGSRAAKMGVKKGDVVSFAVALSNLSEEESKSSLMAEKLIKRLESVGMRTSYRELFDLFLSKTTNNRPIGIVFRRWKRSTSTLAAPPTSIPKLLSPKNGAKILNPINSADKDTEFNMSDEFEWSTDFLQALSIKSREYEFEQKVPFQKNQALEDNEAVLSYLPRPNIDTTSNPSVDLFSMIALAEKYNCGANSLPFSSVTFMQSALGVNQNESTTTEEKDDFLSHRTLCSLVEQAVGLIFMRQKWELCSLADVDGGVGSGFVVARTGDASWSPPCFLSTQCKKHGGNNSSQTMTLIVVRKTELINRLILGDTVKFGASKKQKMNVLVRDAAIIGMDDGRFNVMTEFMAATTVNEEQNQSAYAMAVASEEILNAREILAGNISPPEQSVDFYGALQSLECPYSMHSHPVLPDSLQSYCDTDWVELSPHGLGTVSAAHGGMRTLLKLISQGGMEEEKREIDVFARKFKYYLMDGVPVQLVLPSNPGCREEKVLRLTIKSSASLSESVLEISRKRRPGVLNVGMQGSFVATLDNITRFSRNPPTLVNLDDEEKKRFFSFETDLSGTPIMMLAKNRKDAMLLLCGMKLLMEREKF